MVLLVLSCGFTLNFKHLVYWRFAWSIKLQESLAELERMIGEAQSDMHEADSERKDLYTLITIIDEAFIRTLNPKLKNVVDNMNKSYDEAFPDTSSPLAEALSRANAHQETLDWLEFKCVQMETEAIELDKRLRERLLNRRL